MYRSCIFCSADLGANDALERFTVGRSLAFDGERGRLWAICPKCARWNLAPLEERWEAIEDAERLFRDTRERAQRDNIGVAKLRDGTRLVRVGHALPAELALWRYGQRLVRKPLVPQLPQLPPRVKKTIDRAAVPGVPALVLYGALAAPSAAVLLGLGVVGAAVLRDRWRNRRVVHVLAGSPQQGGRIIIRYGDLVGTRLAYPDDGAGIQLFFPFSTRGIAEGHRHHVNLRGDEAQSALGRVIVHVNAPRAAERTVASSLEMLARAGSCEALVREVAHGGAVLSGDAADHPGGIRMAPEARLALEMALHTEQERRALEGELAGLREMWRQAEQIAAIADRLPDVPAADPPRI